MDNIFETAAQRIAFSEAVDFIEQGRANLIPPDQLDEYLRKGLLRRNGNTLEITEEGLRQHHIAVQERFSDG